MLMNHKNFHFTQIPDKTNDMIFLESPKTMFLGHFWPFSVIFARWGFFPKIPALSHITRYGPLTPCSISEKTNEAILRKLMDRRKDGRTDRPYFIGPFRPRRAASVLSPDAQNRAFAKNRSCIKILETTLSIP